MITEGQAVQAAKDYARDNWESWLEPPDPTTGESRDDVEGAMTYAFEAGVLWTIGIFLSNPLTKEILEKGRTT